jgi:nitrogen fixation protein FixH
MDIAVDKNPPVVGNNVITIKITDPAGRPVTDAKVRVEYGMPAMQGMPAMDYHADAVLNGQAYRAKVELPMGGSWNTVVKMKRGNKVLAAEFNLETQ